MWMKKLLREQILSKRKAMTHQDVLKKSLQIKHRLLASSDFMNAQTILFYVSYDNEVYTHEMIKESLGMGKHVVVPKTNARDGTLSLSRLTQWDDLESGAYSILEPKKECMHVVSAEVLDLIILPGVVFDCEGNRIGHGMGCYDRLLTKVHGCLRIGLAFELQIVDSIPSEKHDVRVDKIITEDRIISC
jgi:5-formyltetrahydrofolate cyclo-ligase